MEVGAITDASELFRLVSLNLERTPTKEEKVCFDEIISLVQGHTLVLELIARQIAAGRLDIHTALGLIRENGFSRFSDERVGNYKDGVEVYDTLSAIVTALFDAGKMSDDEKLALKVLSLLNVRGLETSLVQKFFPEISEKTLSELSTEGWLYNDDRIHLHPVIAETVQHWKWSADDVTVMDYHKKIVGIYDGMANSNQIREIIREADAFRDKHPRHIITAMYYDMLGCYYELLLYGAYYPINDQEAELLENLTDCARKAINEIELSSDGQKTKYLVKYCLSLAGIIIRSNPPGSCDEAKQLLDRIQGLFKKDSEDHCYYNMVSAWYYTLGEPDIEKTKALTEQAESIAKQVFKTDLEIIDIIHIPTANCYFYHDDLQAAAEKLKEAVVICKQYPDVLPYIDKQAELLNCLLDVYNEMGDMDRCRELIKEIDGMNEKYKDQGICREVNPGIREKAGS